MMARRFQQLPQCCAHPLRLRCRSPAGQLGGWHLRLEDSIRTSYPQTQTNRCMDNPVTARNTGTHRTCMNVHIPDALLIGSVQRGGSRGDPGMLTGSCAMFTGYCVHGKARDSQMQAARHEPQGGGRA